MAHKGFLDILFILLCATIVMLSESIQLEAVDLAPARVGQGGTSPVAAADVKVVVVRAEGLEMDGQAYASAHATRDALKPEHAVVLVAGAEQLPHQRMMTVWSDYQALGRSPRLGVMPGAKQEGTR